VYNDLGAFNAASKRFQEVITLEPTNVEAYQRLGAALTQNGKYDQAVTALQRAVQLKSDDALTYYNLGVALQRDKQYPEAIAQYQQAILLNPNLAEAVYNRGIALVQSQQRDQGISALLEARRLFNQQGKLNKVNEVDQYVQKLAEQPTMILPVVEPTLPPVTQPQQPLFPSTTPMNPTRF
jgi:superkiller protein 3